VSFSDIESSVERGEPVELYLFRYGDKPDQYYAYTDAEKPITRNLITHRPIPIKRSAIVMTGTQDRAALTVNMAAFAEVPELYRVHSPSSVVWLEIYQGHANDAEHEFIQCWYGRALSCRWKGREAILTCEPMSTGLKRPGLRRNYQIGCPLVLYDPRTCRASKAAATVTATVQSLDGALVQLSVSASAQHAGGMIEWVQPNGRNETRTIVGVPGGAYLLSGFPVGLSVGMEVSVVRGCDHTLVGCQSHDNVPNYGGQPWIPIVNPMSSISPFK